MIQVKRKRGIGVLMKQATQNFDPKNREQAIMAMVTSNRSTLPPSHLPTIWEVMKATNAGMLCGAGEPIDDPNPH